VRRGVAGWWGEEPPFHAPVFVLTHHERQPLSMQGGTTFTFATDGIEAALDQARAAAGEGDVAIAGGANVVRQYFAAGLLDVLYLHIVPTVLGAGERLLEDAGRPPPRAGQRRGLARGHARQVPRQLLAGRPI
jgi:dihydrofolate reductase